MRNFIDYGQNLMVISSLKKSDFFTSPKNSTLSSHEELNRNRGGVYAEGHRQGVQVKGLLGRNPERARNGGAENECFEANSTG